MSNQAKRFELVEDFDNTIEAEASILDTIADDIKSAALKYDKLAVVINSCYGGFELSPKAIALYKELSGEEFSYEATPRHNPDLVRVVMMLGKEANNDSDLRIIELSNSQYIIQEYDGAEIVRCPEDIEWKHAEPEYGQLYNQYDGNTYKTVKIGNQIWMAENLEGDQCNLHSNNDKIECPDGWHVPTVEEFKELLEFVGKNTKTCSDNLRSSFFEDGKDLYGFSAFPLDNPEEKLYWTRYLTQKQDEVLYIDADGAYMACPLTWGSFDGYVRLIKGKEDTNG